MSGFFFFPATPRKQHDSTQATYLRPLVQLYPYTFRNGVEFVDMVGDLNPAGGWKRTVAVAPVLNLDTLPTLAGVGQNSLDYTALFTAGG